MQRLKLAFRVLIDSCVFCRLCKQGLTAQNFVQQVLNYLAGGREVGNLVSIACQSILARPASSASKRLAYDIAKTAALSSDDWDSVCEGLRADLAGMHSAEVSFSLQPDSCIPVQAHWHMFCSFFVLSTFLSNQEQVWM